MKYLKSYKLFESNQDLVSLFSDEFVEEYYKENYPVDGDEIYNYMDGWRYVDDDKFVEDHIDGEVDYYVGDFDNIYDNDNDKDDKLIPYLKDLIYEMEDEKEIMNEINKLFIKHVGKKELKNIDNFDVDEKMTELTSKEVIQLMNDYGDIETFVRKELEERYENSDAKEILGAFYGLSEINDPSFFMENKHNIQQYVDEDDMRKDYEDEISDYEMRERVGEDIENSEDLQRELFVIDPKTCVDMIDFVEQNLAEEYDFQKAYIETILKGVKKNKKESVLVDNIKKYFLDNNYELDDEIVKEYDLTAYIEGLNMGFFDLKTTNK